MVDKNKNGVDDAVEAYQKRLKDKQAIKPRSLGERLTNLSDDPKGAVYEPSVDHTKGTEGIGTFIGGLMNAGDDMDRRGNNFMDSIGRWVTSRPQAELGAGYGDSRLGAERNYAGATGTTGSRNRRGSGSSWDPPEEKPSPGMSFADYLQMASGIFGGGNSIPMANYDPQRNLLKQNAADNDSRLEAMYRQLRGSIDADAPVIQKGYQDAIDSTAQNAATAQQNTQAATDSANSRNDAVLANLGIEQAMGNQIQQGTDLSSQTARQITDQASRGQAAGDRLVSNQATAVNHNTNVGNAAGLEGNLQRATNQAKLQSLLGQLGMQEEQENASRIAQNNSQNGIGEQIRLAQWMMGDATDERRYQDSISQSAAELAAKGQGQGKVQPDLGAFLQAMGIDPEDVAKNPQKYAAFLGSASKYSVTP